MNKLELLKRIAEAKRDETEERPSASVQEAIGTLLDCCEFLLREYKDKNMIHICDNIRDYTIATTTALQGDSIYCSLALWKEIKLMYQVKEMEDEKKEKR